MQPPLILDFRTPGYEIILSPAWRTEWLLVGIVIHSNFKYKAQRPLNHWAAYGLEHDRESWCVMDSHVTRHKRTVDWDEISKNGCVFFYKRVNGLRSLENFHIGALHWNGSNCYLSALVHVLTFINRVWTNDNGAL